MGHWDVTPRNMALTTAVVCFVGAAVVLYKKVNSRACERKIREARDKREKGFGRADQKVLQFKKEHPTTDTTGILTLSLKELQEKLQQDALSPEEVLFSYMEKTLALQTKLNCCTEILLESFDEAKTVGPSRNRPLYGVPVSVKDNIGYKGYDSTCGVVINLDKPAKNNSVLVEVLKKQGAIPFVKTNVPQALLSFDCSNLIFGGTVNPHNALRTPGGSSGGEGALIGGGGSLIGLGTDIGGSIRVPASFCGICGLKPTSGRLRVSVPFYRDKNQATVGPMARDVDSLARFMEALLCDDMFFLDPTVPPLPFNKQIYESATPLRIGYMISDGVTQPSPSMARAVRETKALLENAGHVLVPYEPMDIERFLFELQTGAFADGAATLLDQLKGEPSDPTFSNERFFLNLPNWLKRTMAFLLKPVCSRISNKIRSACGVGSVQNLWKNHVFITEYTHKTVAHWRKSKIDVLLCPAIGPAYQAYESHKIPHCLSLTAIYNGLNFPAGVVPVSTVTTEDEEELEHYEGYYRDVWDKSFKKVVSGGAGLPVAVQCVALPWQEELCLRFMREVERLVHESRH